MTKLEEELKKSSNLHGVRIILGIVVLVLLGILWVLGWAAIIVFAFISSAYLIGIFVVKIISRLAEKYGWKL